MKCFLMFIIFLFSSTLLLAQSSLNDVKLISTQGVVFHFDVYPFTVSSSLSEDKTQISIEFQKVVRNTPKKTYSFLSTIVRECTIEEKDASCIVRIQLNSKNGYTISKLAFSNSLFVEIFQWDKLSAADDVYRTGLLSLSDKLPDIAKEYFDSAYNLGNNDVLTILAIEELNKKNYAYSLEHSLRAIEKKLVHPDNFALVSILLQNHSPEVAEKYRQYYMRKTGLKSIQFGNEIGRFKIPIELDSLAVKLSRNFDTTSVTIVSDSSKRLVNTVDTLPQIVTKISRPPIQAYKPTTQAIVLGSLVLLLIVGIIVFRKNLFPKKKSEQFEEEDTTIEENQNIGVHFDEVLKDENEMLTEYSEVNQDNEIKNEDVGRELEIENELESLILKEEMEEDNTNEPLHSDNEQFHNQQDDLLQGIQEISPANTVVSKGKLDFAENIKTQISQKKEETISNLRDMDLPNNSFQISSKAKELGVEKEVLDIEKSIQELTNDEDSQKSLKKKFL